ncbi:hypothetical protein QTP88_012449 [Uroleucon formosanum]
MQAGTKRFFLTKKVKLRVFMLWVSGFVFKLLQHKHNANFNVAALKPFKVSRANSFKVGFMHEGEYGEKFYSNFFVI